MIDITFISIIFTTCARMTIAVFLLLSDWCNSADQDASQRAMLLGKLPDSPADSTFVGGSVAWNCLGSCHLRPSARLALSPVLLIRTPKCLANLCEKGFGRQRGSLHYLPSPLLVSDMLMYLTLYVSCPPRPFQGRGGQHLHKLLLETPVFSLNQRLSPLPVETTQCPCSYKSQTPSKRPSHYACLIPYRIDSRFP